MAWDWLHTALSTGALGALGAALKSHTSAKQADSKAKQADAERALVEARMVSTAQEMVSRELGTARGDLVRAREALDEAAAKHQDCERRVSACEDKHAHERKAREALGKDLEALKATVQRLTPVVPFPAVKEPKT